MPSGRNPFFDLFDLENSGQFTPLPPVREIGRYEGAHRLWQKKAPGFSGAIDNAREIRSSSICRLSYGTTELTEVPQLAKPSLVPSQVPTVRVNSDPKQFWNWM